MSMSANFEKVFDQTAAATTDWVRFNDLSEGRQIRTYSGNLVDGGDSIVINVTNDKNPNTTSETVYAIVTHGTAGGFGGTIEGDWNWFQVVKTGSAGAATLVLNV